MKGDISRANGRLPREGTTRPRGGAMRGPRPSRRAAIACKRRHTAMGRPREPRRSRIGASLAPITSVVGTHRGWADVAHIGHGPGRIDLEGDELVRALLPEDGELRLALIGGKDSGHFDVSVSSARRREQCRSGADLEQERAPFSPRCSLVKSIPRPRPRSEVGTCASHTPVFQLAGCADLRSRDLKSQTKAFAEPTISARHTHSSPPALQARVRIQT